MIHIQWNTMDGGQHIICIYEPEDETCHNLIHCNVRIIDLQKIFLNKFWSGNLNLHFNLVITKRGIKYCTQMFFISYNFFKSH